MYLYPFPYPGCRPIGKKTEGKPNRVEKQIVQLKDFAVGKGKAKQHDDGGNDANGRQDELPDTFAIDADQKHSEHKAHAHPEQRFDGVDAKLIGDHLQNAGKGERVQIILLVGKPELIGVNVRSDSNMVIQQNHADDENAADGENPFAGDFLFQSAKAHVYNHRYITSLFIESLPSLLQ